MTSVSNLYLLSPPGIALLYLQLHRVSSEASHLQRALDYAKRSLRNLNGRKVTFLCGDAGPLAVGAVVYHRLKNTEDSKECITKYVKRQKPHSLPHSQAFSSPNGTTGTGGFKCVDSDEREGGTFQACFSGSTAFHMGLYAACRT